MSTDAMSGLTPLILIVHAAATLMMTGLVWFVHVVHYPMFARVAEAGPDAWARYEREHLRRTGLVIPPLMLPELITAAVLPFIIAPGDDRVLAWVGFGLAVLVWLSTFAGAVPMHTRLERGFDAGVLRRLLAFNLVRTVAWSGRSIIALVLLLPDA
jgi:hypothetical protein